MNSRDDDPAAAPERLPVPRAPGAGALAPRRGAAGPERGLEVGDTLTRYMAQLAQHAPISREQEHELALRWHNERDLEAARQLVLANLRLVVKIAHEYRRAWTNTLDLIQEGNLGLLQAVQRFDPYAGVKLSSYGAYWIRAYILKYILDNIRTVRLGRSRAERKIFFRLNKERRELERLGFEPTPRLLAERMEVSEDDVRSMEERLGHADLSMNAPLRRGEDDAEYGDFVAAQAAGSEELVADAELKRLFLDKVQSFARGCDAREQRILETRMLAEEPRTLQELGEEFGVSRERVRQLEARLLERLSAYMKQEMVDFDVHAAPED